MLSITSFVVERRVTVFLAGICLGIGMTTFAAAELLRRFGRTLFDAPREHRDSAL